MVAKKLGNDGQSDPAERRDASAKLELQEGNMTRSVDRESHISPGLLKVVDRARKDPKARLYSLAGLIDQDSLKRAFA